MSSRSADAPGGPAGPTAPSSWSLSARLSLLFAASSLTVLLAAGIFLDLVFARGIFEDERRSVSEQIETVAGVVERDPELGGADGSRVRWIYATVENSDYLLRVLDDRGRVVFETPGLEDLLPGRIFPSPSREPASTRSGPRVLRRDGRFYVVAARRIETRDDARPERIIQLAYDGTSEDVLLAKYRDEALVAMALASFLVVVLAFVLVRRGLRPLQEITRATQDISAAHLDRRIGQRRWPKELSALAAAFDEMLARLERSVSGLSQFSADLAHELRTPLNNLIGEAEVALSRPRGAEEYRETLESSLEECGRLARLTEELLFLARAEGDRAGFAREPADLRELAEDVRGLYEAVAEDRGIKLECRGAAALLASPSLLRRALINLVSNAVQYTPPGGRVEISVERADGGARIQVADDGDGIPPEHVSRIFDRFYQVDASRSREAPGTGLGLAIVRTIVDLHRGRIEVESRVGQGTRVTVELPDPPGSPPTAAGPAAGHPKPSSRS